MFGRWVQIEFECLPLRSVSRFDVPVDASPKYEAFVQRVKNAIDKHGSHNTYYLHQGLCVYHLTNDPAHGEVSFDFEGVAMTDKTDRKTRSVDLITQLRGETCTWLNEPIVEFLAESVKHSVLVEFDRYIEAGDLEKTRQRIAEIEKQAEESGGFVGMYL
ncbi:MULTISPECIES: hypothetical protein [Crateriforma]|uniref:Uncharacterized protein n=1 Tax=Crateriforma conspicua TaxID=2527996 RepID=A0A5C6FY59_9PLAN|nr:MULTISPECIES: hypothetical protein [Crateriforma]TWU66268.1 hypothetical protein V7x_18310 [Crateriforma conspicua]